jgi:vancomycin permeability regulator SanA
MEDYGMVKKKTGQSKNLIAGGKQLFRKILIPLVILVLLPNLVTLIMSLPRWKSVESASVRPVAIVFGAGLYPDGTPMPALEDRILYAAHLYQSEKVQTILMSGDRRSDSYDEPAAMRTYAIKLGVPEKAIILDNAGFRTYDTCYRAKNIFHMDKAILVTTDYHLPRALFLCNSLGIDSTGIASGWGSSIRGPYYYLGILREIPATYTAFKEVTLGL